MGKKPLPAAVVALRGKLGLSQQVFATNLGISIRALANYEKDREPPIELLLSLSSLAQGKGDDALTRTFSDAFTDRLFASLQGRRVRLLRVEQPAGKETHSGLLLVTISNREQTKHALRFFQEFAKIPEPE